MCSVQVLCEHFGSGVFFDYSGAAVSAGLHEIPAQIGTRDERGRRRNRSGTCSTEKKIACVPVTVVTGDLANGIGCDYDLVRIHFCRGVVFSDALAFRWGVSRDSHTGSPFQGSL